MAPEFLSLVLLLVEVIFVRSREIIPPVVEETLPFEGFEMWSLVERHHFPFGCCVAFFVIVATVVISRRFQRTRHDSLYNGTLAGSAVLIVLSIIMFFEKSLTEWRISGMILSSMALQCTTAVVKWFELAYHNVNASTKKYSITAILSTCIMGIVTQMLQVPDMIKTVTALAASVALTMAISLPTLSAAMLPQQPIQPTEVKVTQPQEEKGTQTEEENVNQPAEENVNQPAEQNEV